MKIIKSSFFNPKKSEFGKFELIPDEGWEISNSFIDYESKLLIVSTSILDKSKWIDNKYNYTIPTKEYKIDLSTLEILDYDGWKKFFNYEKKEILSEDGKLKLISKRNYEEDRDSDGIQEELYEVDTNKLISSSDSIAFNDRKREDLLEDHYNRVKEFEDYKKRLDEKLTLNQFHEKKFENLTDAKPIISYYDSLNTFKLDFKNNKFVFQKSPSNITKYNFKKIKEFETLEEFWLYFTSNKNWFKEYSLNRTLTQQPFLLSKFIFNTFNSIRQSQDFSYSDADKINNWQQLFISDEFKRTEIKQWCSHCETEISYSARYPKYICGNCYSKDKLSKKGELLELYNLSLSGGLKIVYKNQEGEILREDDTQLECLCLIDNKEFIAQEAKFGGIVMQKK